MLKRLVNYAILMTLKDTSLETSHINKYIESPLIISLCIALQKYNKSSAKKITKVPSNDIKLAR